MYDNVKTINEFMPILLYFDNKQIQLTPPDLGNSIIFTKSGISLFNSLYNLSWSITAIMSTEIN